MLGAARTGFLDRFGAQLEHVVDAEHRHGMADLLESFNGRTTDAEGGGVRVVKLGVLRFQRFQFAKQSVVLGVGDFRFGLSVIEPVVAVEQRAQLADPILRAGCGS